MQKIKVEHHTLSGGLWFGAWMFTIGFLHLTLGKALIGIIIWPYFLGVALSHLVR